MRLFGEYGGYGAGEQQRDFVFIDDVVAVNLWFLAHPERSPASSTWAPAGRSRSTTWRAPSVNACRARAAKPRLTLGQLVAPGLIEYIDFPAALVGKYQCYTQADLAALRAAGCDHEFIDVASGIGRYLAWLQRQA